MRKTETRSEWDYLVKTVKIMVDFDSFFKKKKLIVYFYL